ncbi:phage tail tape measure protein [Aeromonas hydrophila]|uniref:phage tail tape measure protein n=1 Tax=Aeromonas hydrophila TaxID=644 RepID=UPI00111731BF|nr:phage tail tape measure protein [Aeromonas hydrophila]TNH88837.1 phage tail tape measure protein [Aeromonas hydrophila]
MNPLKLQILLGAVDKLTAPLKAVSGQSRLTAKDLVDTKKKIRDIETQAGQIEGYKTLGAQIGATKAKLKQAEGSFSELQRKIADTPKPTRLMINELNKAEKAINLLKTKQGEMITRHAQMGEAMRKTGINTSNLSETQRRLKTDLAAANTVLDSQRAKLGQLADQQKRLNQVKASYRQTQELRGQIAGHGATAIAAGTAIGMPVYSAIKEYSNFEDAMKGVAKQVDGARTDSGELTSVYYDMAKEIKAISEEIPQLNGAIDIAALVEGAARMGVQGQENLLKFARTSAKAATAFELPAGQLAEDMGKIANLYKIPIGNIEELGDAINYLDDNAQSKGADIIDVLQRLGGVADKLDFRKAAALGSTFLSLGAAPEIAASASNAMVRELSIATMQSKRFQAGMKAIGMQSTAVEKAMATDAMGTITKVLEKIKTLNAEDQLRVTTQIFGKEYGKDAAKLSNNLDELYRQLKLVNAEKSKGSMQRESDIDKDSLSSQWLILQAGIKNVKADLGEKLRGSLMDIIKYIKQVVVGVRHWVEENPELANTLVRVAAVTSVIAIAMGGLSLAVATLLGPMAIMKLIFGVLGVTFGGMLGAIGALLAPLAALAALGIAIIKFWQPISAFFSGLWQGIMTGLAPVFEAFKPFAPLIDAIGTGVKALSGWFGDLLEPIKFSKETLEGFGSAGQFVGRILGEAFNLAMTPLKAFLKGIEWLLESLGILEAKKLPSFQMTAPTASTQGYLNGNFGSPALSSGYSYGPRIVQTAKPVPTRGASSTTEINAPIHIVQQPGQSAVDVAQEVRRELDKRERQAAARGRATLGDRN